MVINKYDYDETKIKAISIIDEYLWIGFEGTGGVSVLKKVSLFNPNQIFYDIDTEFDDINRIKSSGNYIYLAINDGTYIGARFNSNTPYTTYTYLTIPSGINEESIDLVLDSSSNLYFLTSGIISGENAKIIKYNSSLVYQSTIDLTTVFNANAIEVDASDNLWVITKETPSKLIKVITATGAFTEYTLWESLAT